MNLIPFDIKEKIELVEDNSDLFIRRAKITFKNGYVLSVVKGFGTYGTEEGLFEIMLLYIPSHLKGKDRELDRLHDQPIGWLSEKKVMDWVYKIAQK